MYLHSYVHVPYTSKLKNIKNKQKLPGNLFLCSSMRLSQHMIIDILQEFVL